MKPDVRPIAEQVRIEPEWNEIRPDPPLRASKRVQSISIAVSDFAEWDMRSGEGLFVMPDGTPLKIDVELIADDGTSFTLDSIGMGPGLVFSYLPPEADASGSRLPQDKTFTKIRMRSDVPLEGGQVNWICVTNY